MAVIIDSDDLKNLDKNIKANIGNCVQFTNGCWIELIEDSGMFWGECPYSKVWGCKADNDYIDTIVSWIEYWNKARRLSIGLRNLGCFSSDSSRPLS